MTASVIVPLCITPEAAARLAELGMRAELEKMIEEIGSKPRVIATGGLAQLIATGSKFIELVDDTLTLEGLRLVYARTR